MKIKRIIRDTLCSLLVLVQIFAFPSMSLAQEAGSDGSSDSTSSTQQQTGAGQTGPTSPTGADSNTYKDNGDGTWSNDYYTWDSNTKQTKPNTPQDYSYNPATGRWDTTEYVYSPESGKYVPNTKTSATNPNAAAASTQSTGAGSSNSGSGGATISNTGPSSNNTISLGTNTNGVYDLFFNGSISNGLTSSAKTGDALVSGNTSAGNALTGDAATLANILNMLQSSWANQGNDVATFINNIDGNVVGDLVIDPNALAYNLGAQNSNIDVNLSANAAIKNNIDLSAQTGNATVDKNTLGGDATSGNAHAMANVINMINSAIHSGKSFLGMVNVNGNFDGDILLPPGVLDALIASTGPSSNNTIGGSLNSNTNVNNTANRTINNDVDATATTGNANVANNTSAGNAKTGTANTSINSMNLVGQNLTGKKGLLVFVNVLGKWVGMVVDPSTGKVIINNTGPNSNNQIGGGNSNQNVSVNSTENSLINNIIKAKAASGDANVTNNTTAGDATTGDADAAVNLLNMIDSNVNMEDWFGVLFINVFGNWFGSFGQDTANGNLPATTPSSAGGSGGSNAAATTNSGNPVNQVFGFVARNLNSSGGQSNNAQVNQSANSDANNDNQAVFGASSTPSDSGSGQTSSAAIQPTQFNWWAVAGALGILATIVVLVREYILALREERSLA